MKTLEAQVGQFLLGCNDFIDSVLWHREVGRARDLLAPPTYMFSFWQKTGTGKNKTARVDLPWHRGLVSGFSPRRAGFDPRPVHVGFLVAVRQVFLRVFQFSPVNIIPPTIYNHLHLHVALTRRTKWRSLETFQKWNAVSEIGQQWIEKYYSFFLSARVLPSAA